MKTYVLLFVLVPFCLKAQKQLSGTVTNSNGEPLPFTNVVLVQGREGTVTNELGYFTLSSSIANDSIKITNVAYYHAVIACNELDKVDTIRLDHAIRALPHVAITNRQASNKLTEIGFFNQSAHGDFKLMPGSQLAIYIANDRNYSGFIQSIHFKIKEAGKCNSLLRLRLIQPDRERLHPGIDLLNANIILSSRDLNKKNHIDVSSYQIRMPEEGVFLILEWVYTIDACDRKSFVSVAATLTVPENIVWFNYRDKAWSRSHRPRLPNGNYMTPLVGLRVGE